MRVKHLVIGLDGVDLDLIEQLGDSKLPHLFSLMNRGAFSRTQVVQPPATLPNWATFLTGVNPGQHGVFDFTTRNGYKVHFTGGSSREVSTWLSRLDAVGFRTACIGFPGTFPPEKLANGIFMSGWDAPVSFRADSSFVWPLSLYEKIRDRWGTLYFDDVNEFNADEPGWHQNLPKALCERIHRKVNLTQWLMDSQIESEDAWDLFAVYFGESDTASHYLWSLHDPQSPRHPYCTPIEEQQGLTEVYQSLDKAVGELLQFASGDAPIDQVEVTIVSDHGSGGSSDKVLFLNRYLESQGLLYFKKQKHQSRIVKGMKEIALTRFPPGLKEKVFRMWDAYLPSLLESNARFGAIDMARSLAFSDELNYFPSIHLNMKGREPQGTVSLDEYDSVVLEIKRALFDLVDPWTGKLVVSKVWQREELFDGPYVERAPDLLLELHLDGGYSYNLMPTPVDTSSKKSSLGGLSKDIWRKLEPKEFLGRKGRSLPGSHRPKGTWIAAGPSVTTFGETQATIEDTSATLFQRMNIAPPSDFSGKVLWQVLRTDQQKNDCMKASTSAHTPQLKSKNKKNEALVEARLRALGYID